jgi:hypothetical protein
MVAHSARSLISNAARQPAPYGSAIRLVHRAKRRRPDCDEQPFHASASLEATEHSVERHRAPDWTSNTSY